MGAKSESVMLRVIAGGGIPSSGVFVKTLLKLE